MELILIRHAKAFDRDPAAWPDDLRRPLTASGREAFGRLAKRLARAGVVVDELLASPATRAWQTARILHERAGWPEPRREERLAPERMDDPAAALRAMLSERSGLTALAMVGHEPDFSRLAASILTGGGDGIAIDFRKGGAISIELPPGPGPGLARGRLRWMLTPRICAARGR